MSLVGIFTNNGAGNKDFDLKNYLSNYQSYTKDDFVVYATEIYAYYYVTSGSTTSGTQAITVNSYNSSTGILNVTTGKSPSAYAGSFTFYATKIAVYVA